MARWEVGLHGAEAGAGETIAGAGGLGAGRVVTFGEEASIGPGPRAGNPPGRRAYSRWGEVV